MKPSVIIGAGLAGYTVARELRKLDKSHPLLIITADSGGFYSKPMLSNAFAQQRQPHQLVTHTAAQMSAQLGASILTGTRVTGIDTHAQTVRTQAGTFEYGQLVLAVGARPIRLALEGDAVGNALSVNHIDDYAVLREHLRGFESGARVTILGAGLIGCEFADDMAGAGHRVTLVDPNHAPLAALAPPALSEGLAHALRARGIDLQLATTATHVDRTATGMLVRLADGRSCEADVVLSAVGLRPDLRLAQLAGLKTGRGIVVDAYGMTSATGIYALGDCAQYCDGETQVCLPYIAPLMSAARALARTLTGTPAIIDLKPTPVIVKTPSFPLALLPPAAGVAGSWHSVADGARLVCRYCDADGVVRGFGVASRDAASRQALMAELGNPTVVPA